MADNNINWSKWAPTVILTVGLIILVVYTVATWNDTQFDVPPTWPEVAQNAVYLSFLAFVLWCLGRRR